MESVAVPAVPAGPNRRVVARPMAVVNFTVRTIQSTWVMAMLAMETWDKAEATAVATVAWPQVRASARTL